MELEKEQMVKAYTDMVRVRKLDEVLVAGLYAGKIAAFYHSQQGMEAVGVGICSFLKADDYVFYTHRGHGIGQCLPKGVPAKEIIAEQYCRITGSCFGIEGFNTCDMDRGVPGSGPGAVAGEFTVAAGMGIACKMRGKGQVVVHYIGDAGTGRGTFHTAHLMAANWKLPVVWVVQNNFYGQWTPVSEAYPKENLADLAFGYGIPGVVVDGQDVAAVFAAGQAAVERARAGEGPTLLELKTYRYLAHVEGWPDLVGTAVRNPDEIAAWKKRDPIELFGKKLLEQGILTQVDLDRIEREAKEEMESAELFAAKSPNSEDPSILAKFLYAD